MLFFRKRYTHTKSIEWFRGTDFLAVLWCGSSHTLSPRLPSASCVSFSGFLCVAGRAYRQERGGGAESYDGEKVCSSINRPILNTLWTHTSVMMLVTRLFWKSSSDSRSFSSYIYSVQTRTQKPNSWTCNFVEVSEHNLESSQTWGFSMDFLNHREGGMVFYQISSFLLYSVQ